MSTIHFTDLVHRFAKVPVGQLKWLTPVDKIQSLIVNDTQEPENLKDSFYDPNDFYIQAKQKFEKKHKQHKQHNNKQFTLGKKAVHEQKKQSKQHKDVEQQVNSPQQKKRVYKAGPFALFYELNESNLNKDQQVWYYKQNKDIIGPVSSYNMDKMAYYKNVDDQTKVAYKSVDKFVKFSKIKKVVQGSKKASTEEPISSQQSQ